jgi:NifB/MoaA-like Fe-S oxidoreductase
MEVKKNRQAQDINSIEEINNNPEPVIEITPTPIITEEEIKPIEQNNTVEEIPQPTPQPAVKNTVRYIDSGFTF